MQGFDLFAGLTYQQYEAIKEAMYKSECKLYGIAPVEIIALPENIAHQVNKEIYQKLK